MITFKIKKGEEFIKKYRLNLNTPYPYQSPYSFESGENVYCTISPEKNFLFLNQTKNESDQLLKRIKPHVYRFEIFALVTSFDELAKELEVIEDHLFIEIDLQTMDINCCTNTGVDFSTMIDIVNFKNLLGRIYKTFPDETLVEFPLYRAAHFNDSFFTTRPTLSPNIKNIEPSFFPSQYFSNRRLADKVIENFTLKDLLFHEDEGVFLALLNDIDTVVGYIPYHLTRKALNSISFRLRMKKIMELAKTLPQSIKLSHLLGGDYESIPEDVMELHIEFCKNFNYSCRISTIFKNTNTSYSDGPLVYEALEYFFTKYGPSNQCMDQFLVFLKTGTLSDYTSFDFKQSSMNTTIESLNRCIRDRFSDSDTGNMKKEDAEKVDVLMDLLEVDPLYGLKLLASNRKITDKQKQEIIDKLK